MVVVARAGVCFGRGYSQLSTALELLYLASGRLVLAVLLERPGVSAFAAREAIHSAPRADGGFKRIFSESGFRSPDFRILEDCLRTGPRKLLPLARTRAQWFGSDPDADCASCGQRILGSYCMAPKILPSVSSKNINVPTVEMTERCMMILPPFFLIACST